MSEQQDVNPMEQPIPMPVLVENASVEEWGPGDRYNDEEVIEVREATVEDFVLAPQHPDTDPMEPKAPEERHGVVLTVLTGA